MIQLLSLTKTIISIKMMSSYPLHKLRIMCLKLYLFPLSMTTIISFQMITSILQFNSIKWLTLHYIISFMLYIRIMSLENMVPIHPGVTCSVSHDIVLLFSYIIGNNFTQLKQFLKSSASIHKSFYYPIAQ